MDSISNNITKLKNIHPLGKIKLHNQNNKRTYERKQLASSLTTTTTPTKVLNRKNNNQYNTVNFNEYFTHFKTWSFGTINIRSGKEKEEEAKIYAVVKEVNRAGLLFCCLQEVKYRNTGSKLIVLDTGESYQFLWCGKKRRREAGVGISIRIHHGIVINSPDVNDPNIMAVNLRIHDFNFRIINGYSPTESGGSDNQKDMFYRQLKTACSKTEKHQKLVLVADFNATTNVATYKSCYDGTKIVEDPNCNENGSRLKSK